ncbi:EAL domain-containing response regulator [Pseudoduganella namucuonensis]|uniref:EAL domain, c-di-GMP-specific phosphodiesterase class I (Or its enzymatically inactive variant) n=1 Tax=Pseudoduganella namucuonensis TaxID=1035707 RepID=A0A1I7M7G2_9BURK|nr:EAL domain-containing response regulator [Pseudoduganella namucuonensis]SFV17874.1 EAL domain, c-di-GMP-specific phosphodiesterase class I (or its enzymatically inactive variant) [Pseudoduganella namucuonensis]
MQDWSGCTALVVEDSPVQREHMAGLLRQAGFGTVLEACDGIDALRKLDARGMPVQLVLTDMDMPGMDGVELIRHLRELELAAAVLVASAREERLREAADSMDNGGARLTLLGTALKPLHFDVLTRLLNQAGAEALSAATTAGVPSASELEDALENRRFLPYYEPRIEVASGLLRCLDVHVCWMHPQRGLIRGARFLPAMQGAACIAPLAMSIVEQALAQLRAWHDIGLVTLTMSIKLPAEVLADRTQLDRLSMLVQQHGLSPRHLTWECAEAVLAGGAPLSIANLAHLSVRGFGLGLGGYRAGHTTQQQLVRCPLTELHVDHFIVHEASLQPARQALLEQAINDAHRMGIAVVAEGVERAADLALLRGLGCELAQGALVAAPMPAQALVGWIKGNRRRLKELAHGQAADGAGG